MNVEKMKHQLQRTAPADFGLTSEFDMAELGVGLRSIAWPDLRSHTVETTEVASRLETYMDARDLVPQWIRDALVAEGVEMSRVRSLDRDVSMAWDVCHVEYYGLNHDGTSKDIHTTIKMSLRRDGRESSGYRCTGISREWNAIPLDCQ